MWDFTCLSFEISVELFFFPFLFSNHFCSVDACVAYIVYGRCNSSSLALFYEVFLSLYRCIDVILNVGKSSYYFFTWHLQTVYFIFVRSYASSLVLLFSRPFVGVLLCFTLRMVPSISPGIYPFDEILFGFYGISIFVGYLIPNPFLYK